MSIKPETLVALIDSREQNPWCLEPLDSKPATLPTGDYSLEGLADLVVIERKSLPDLLGVIGGGRERFERELSRMRGYRYRVVIVEADWGSLEAGDYRSKISPSAATGSIAAWAGRYQIGFQFCGSRAGAEQFAVKFLCSAARHELRRLAALQQAVSGSPGPSTCAAPE